MSTAQRLKFLETWLDKQKEIEYLRQQVSHNDLKMRAILKYFNLEFGEGFYVKKQKEVKQSEQT